MHALAENGENLKTEIPCQKKIERSSQFTINYECFILIVLFTNSATIYLLSIDNMYNESVDIFVYKWHVMFSHFQNRAIVTIHVSTSEMERSMFANWTLDGHFIMI